MGITGFIKRIAGVKTSISDEDIAKIQLLKKEEPKYSLDTEVVVRALHSAQEMVFSKSLGPDDIAEVMDRVELFEKAVKKRDDALVKSRSADVTSYVDSLSKRRQEKGKL